MVDKKASTAVRNDMTGEDDDSDCFMYEDQDEALSGLSEEDNGFDFLVAILKEKSN